MWKPYFQTFKSPLSPWEVYQTVCLRTEKSFFLDSIQHKAPDQNDSYIGMDPFLEVTARDGKVYVTGREKGVYPEKNLFPVLRALFKKYQAKNPKPFFTGGGVGFWGYELAPLLDRISLRRKTPAGSPKLYLGFFDTVILYHHASKKYEFAVHAENASQAALKFKTLKSFFGKPELSPGTFSFKTFRPGISKPRFEAMVRRAKRYIEAGDIYQANLSQRFSFDFRGDALKLYGTLRRINPSPFASFLNLGDFKIISSSPERLVLKKGNLCETRPIAGTRSRPKNVRKEKILEKELRENAKERAEHIMLVDLERNDLGRVCDFRSVKVKELMAVEKYSHVMHLVSKVTGTLSKGKDALDLLKAVFPGGTITGCPKIRCMEIIDELEPVQRGIYTGSIGYLGFDGDMDLNIVIRTLVLQKNKGYLQVGAGIVYDSDPAREYEETLHKGEAMAQALVQASL